MPFQHRGSPAANADAAGHGGRAPVRPEASRLSPAACRRRACSQAGQTSQAASGREARTCLRKCTWPGSRGRRIHQSMQILPGPPVKARPQMPEPALHDEEGMLHLGADGCLPGFDAFSARKRAVRPFMVEGFLATVSASRRGGDRRAASGRFATPVATGSAWQNASSSLTRGMRHGHVGHVCGGRLHGMRTRPLPASTPICAPCIRNASSCPSWTGCASGSRAWPVLRGARRLDEGGITMEPPRILIHRLLRLGIEIAGMAPAESLPLEDMAGTSRSSRPAPVPA